MRELRQFCIEQFLPCHCTGFCAQVVLQQALAEGFGLNGPGDRLEFAV